MAFLPACHNSLFNVPGKATSPTCMSSDVFVYLFIFFYSFFMSLWDVGVFFRFITWHICMYDFRRDYVCEVETLAWSIRIGCLPGRLLGFCIFFFCFQKRKGSMGNRQGEKKCVDIYNNYIWHVLDISSSSFPGEKMWNAHSRPATPAMTVGPFDLSCNRLRYLLLWQEI